MKKFALFFVLALSVLAFVGCSTNTVVLSGAPKENEEVENKEIVLDEPQSEQKERTMQEELDFVLDEICKQDKQFERDTAETYRTAKTQDLLDCASQNESFQIAELARALETAIANGESLLPKEHSPATGAAKLVEDLDSLLFTVWHNMLTQRQ